MSFEMSVIIVVRVGTSSASKCSNYSKTRTKQKTSRQFSVSLQKNIPTQASLAQDWEGFLSFETEMLLFKEIQPLMTLCVFQIRLLNCGRWVKETNGQKDTTWRMRKVASRTSPQSPPCRYLSVCPSRSFFSILLKCLGKETGSL